MTTVKDLMDSRIIPVAPSTTIAEVARQMLSHQRAVPVCNGGKFMGIITERDIITRAVASGCDLNKATASTMLNGKLPVISPQDDIWLAINLMVDNTIHELPVVENGEFKGLFTLDDLARESPAIAAMVFAKTVKAHRNSG